jgi:hypothetical protein
VKEAEILPCEREKGVTALRCKVEKFKCLIGCYTPANSKKKREKKDVSIPFTTKFIFCIFMPHSEKFKYLSV